MNCKKIFALSRLTLIWFHFLLFHTAEIKRLASQIKEIKEMKNQCNAFLLEFDFACYKSINSLLIAHNLHATRNPFLSCIYFFLFFNILAFINLYQLCYMTFLLTQNHL